MNALNGVRAVKNIRSANTERKAHQVDQLATKENKHKHMEAVTCMITSRRWLMRL
jgi:hypothetical protein